MAEDLNGAEFWLPPDFLDDDFFHDKGASADCDGTDGGGGAGGGDSCLPTEFEWGSGSDLSSPVDSVIATESSDEEEDYMAALTRQMSRHYVQDDEKGSFPALGTDKTMATSTVGSPQSTLCGVWSWNSSGRENSEGPSLVSSPLSSPLEKHKQDAWGMLNAAAGQVVPRRQSDEAVQEAEHGGRGILGTPAQKPSPPENVTTGGYYGVNQFQQPKHQQVMKQQGTGAAWGRQKRPKGGGIRPTRPLGLSAAAWPPLQQQAGSGMRAVFLAPDSKRESSGTGVFLPRMAGNTAELRKKPACSTVLLPAKVIQALNLDLNEIGAQPRFPGGFVLDRDAVVARSNALQLHRRTSQRPQQGPTGRHQHEPCLPSEWTY